MAHRKLAKMFGESGAAGVHFEDQLHGGKKVRRLEDLASFRVSSPCSRRWCLASVWTCGRQGPGAHIRTWSVTICTGFKLLELPDKVHCAVTRLIAARLQWDIMGLETISIARTDAESAKLISSTADANDHPFILGIDTGENPGLRPLAQELASAERSGASGASLAALEAEWMSQVKLVTFREAFEQQLRDTVATTDRDVAKLLASFDDYLASLQSFSIRDMSAAAEAILGRPCHWDCELPRTREGYYHYQGGFPAAIQRAVTFAPYADMLWLETKTPDLAAAETFSQAIHALCPDKWLVYNLSPSFNWGAHGVRLSWRCCDLDETIRADIASLTLFQFTDQKLKSFIWDLAQSGFVLQLISLAGLHATAVTMHELAHRYLEDGMLAYVELIQQKERELGCDVVSCFPVVEVDDTKDDLAHC